MKNIGLFSLVFFTVLFSYAQNCLQGNSIDSLNINNVNAFLFNGGNMFFDPSSTSETHYKIPKSSGKQSILSASLWLGGLDSNDSLYVCAQTYRQGVLASYWPGPLNYNSSSNQLPSINNTDCDLWSHHYKINKDVIVNFIDDYNSGNINSISDVPSDILYWPAKNNPYITDGRDMDNDLAPFEDNHHDGVYDPLDGDFPEIYGHQAVWWVMNDVGNVKDLGTGPMDQTVGAIGLEIQVQAFAYSACDLNNVTFYKYTLKNKGHRTLHDTYAGIWSDIELGYGLDDMSGCDVERGMYYGYNGDDFDGDTGLYNAYYDTLPAVGFDFVKGIEADANDGIDNDKDGTTDESEEEIYMSNFMHYLSGFDIQFGHPAAPDHFYNYITTLWRNGVDVTYGGNGQDTSALPCKYFFPDSSDMYVGWGVGGTPSSPITLPPWSNESGGILPRDIYGLIGSMGPFTFVPGETKEFVLAIPWAQSTEGARAALKELRKVDDLVQNAWDNNFAACPVLDVPMKVTKASLQVYPNPFTHDLTFDVRSGKPEVGSLKIVDAVGRVVYQKQFISNTPFTVQEDFPKGLYFAQIRVGEQVEVVKVVKQ